MSDIPDSWEDYAEQPVTKPQAKVQDKKEELGTWEQQLAKQQGIKLKKAGQFAAQEMLLQAKTKSTTSQQPKAPTTAQKSEAQLAIKPAAKPVSTAPKAPTIQQKYEHRRRDLEVILQKSRQVNSLFGGLSEDNKATDFSRVVLKKQADFQTFAKNIAGRFTSDEQIDSDMLEQFTTDLLIWMFDVMKAKDLDKVWEKLKILKSQKKKDGKQKATKKKKEPKKEEKPKVEEKKAEQDDFM